MALFSLFEPLVNRFGTQANKNPEALYAAIGTQARNPVLYQAFGIEDNRDQRLEMLLLHLFFPLYALKQYPDLKGFSQKLFDYAFMDIDQNLREMGVGDLSVGKKVKDLAKVYYGRLRQYEALLNGDTTVLDVFPALANKEEFKAYIISNADGFQKIDKQNLINGHVNFAENPDTRAPDTAA